VDRAGAHLYHRNHIRAQRVADHDELLRLDLAAAQHRAVGVDVLSLRISTPENISASPERASLLSWGSELKHNGGS
jgi:hypothetical protein